MPRCAHLYCASDNGCVVFPKSTQDIQRWMTLTERDSEREFYLYQARLKPGAEDELLAWASRQKVCWRHFPKHVVLQLIAANYTGGRKEPPVSKSGDFAPTLTFREWVFDSRPDLGDGLPEGSECFKRVPLHLNTLDDEKKTKILDSSSSRAAEAAAPSADKLRAAAHTAFVQGTAEHLIAKNSELQAKIKVVETKLGTAVASQAAIKRKLEKSLESQTSKQQAELLDLAHQAIVAKRLRETSEERQEELRALIKRKIGKKVLQVKH